MTRNNGKDWQNGHSPMQTVLLIYLLEKSKNSAVSCNDLRNKSKQHGLLKNAVIVHVGI